MTVPYSFASRTTAIQLSELDSNFNTAITLGNTAIQLGNTVTTLNNMTLANVTISSGTINVATGNVTVNNLTAGNTTISTSETLSYGTANGVAYLNGSKVLTTGSALTFDGSTLVAAGQVNLGGASNSLYVGNDSSSTGSLYVALGMVSSNGGANPLRFGLNGSEQMRLTSTGLGIGTSSPSKALSVAAATAGITLTSTTGTNNALFQVTNTGGSFYVGKDNSAGTDLNTAPYASVLYSTGAYPIVLAANGYKMTFDSSGNLGLGVTPSAWASSGNIEIPAAGCVIGSGSSLYVGQNWYYGSSAFRYKTTAAAAYYLQSAGAHSWYTAPSGTAGNAISFTQAMTLDASGNLGIGTSSPGYRLDISQSTSGAAAINVTNTYGGGATARLILTNSSDTNGSGFQIINNGGDGVVNLLNYKSTPLAFWTAGSERMRIDSSGNLLVGTTGSLLNSRLYVKGSSTSNADLNFLFTNSAGNTILAAYNDGALYATSMKSGAGTNAVKFSTSTGQITYDTSSARYKNNIRDSIYGLSHVMQMRSAQFEYKDDGRSDVGLIAEELDPIIPELVGKTKDGQPDSVSYDRIVSVLVKAVQELKAELDATKAEVAALKGV